MDKKIFSQLLQRKPDSHKYDYGHVLVVGGSPGMVGAPLLVGKAAFRTGAGLVTIASSAAVTDKLERRVEEIMTLSLSSEASEAISALDMFIKDRKVSVIVIGPGLKNEPWTAALISHLLQTAELPLVIDAGGLAIVQHHIDQLDKAVSKNIVLTPHTGEFQRFLDKPLPPNRLELKPVAAQFVRKHHVTLVLKGEPTYVASPGEELYENTTGNPGLATAGTGDVLSGVIAGIIAQGIEPRRAAPAAVYLHGLAGDLAAHEKTEPGMIASDVIEAIPAALKHISARKNPV